MRVLIDCTGISKVKAGVGVYAINLVKELIAIKQDLQLWLLVQDDDQEFDFHEDGVKTIRVPARIFRRVSLRLLLQQIYLPWLALRHRIEVIHSLHYSFPLLPLRARNVVTIHDLTSFLCPELLIPNKMRYYRLFIKASHRGADELIFVSYSTRHDYCQAFPRALDSCHVVMLGKSPEFRSDLATEKVAEVLHRYALKEPYILFIGMIEPRKNLNRLVDAFSALASAYPDHSLVIAGKKGWMYEDLFALIRDKGLDKKVLFPGYISEEDKPYLIRGAEVFVYPSLYEGFGIPVLEALACGTPTITSNVSSMPEVAGDAALLVDPTNTEELTLALSRLLADKALRDDLIVKSIAQAEKFSWKKTAAETYTVYLEAVWHK